MAVIGGDTPLDRGFVRRIRPSITLLEFDA
jgi:hypothetical protein